MWAEGCRRLAAHGGSPLLEVGLVRPQRVHQEWVVDSVNVFPQAQSHVEVAAIVDLLEAQRDLVGTSSS
jgi:hypothetical protein